MSNALHLNSAVGDVCEHLTRRVSMHCRRIAAFHLPIDNTVPDALPLLRLDSNAASVSARYCWFAVMIRNT